MTRGLVCLLLHTAKGWTFDTLGVSCESVAYLYSTFVEALDPNVSWPHLFNIIESYEPSFLAVRFYGYVGRPLAAKLLQGVTNPVAFPALSVTGIMCMAYRAIIFKCLEVLCHL